MKKQIASLLAAAFATLVLFGCGGSHSTAASAPAYALASVQALYRPDVDSYAPGMTGDDAPVPQVVTAKSGEITFATASGPRATIRLPEGTYAVAQVAGDIAIAYPIGGNDGGPLVVNAATESSAPLGEGYVSATGQTGVIVTSYDRQSSRIFDADANARGSDAGLPAGSDPLDVNGNRILYGPLQSLSMSRSASGRADEDPAVLRQERLGAFAARAKAGQARGGMAYYESFSVHQVGSSAPDVRLAIPKGFAAIMPMAIHGDGTVIGAAMTERGLTELIRWDAKGVPQEKGPLNVGAYVTGWNADGTFSIVQYSVTTGAQVSYLGSLGSEPLSASELGFPGDVVLNVVDKGQYVFVYGYASAFQADAYRYERK